MGDVRRWRDGEREEGKAQQGSAETVGRKRSNIIGVFGGKV